MLSFLINIDHDKNYSVLARSVSSTFFCQPRLQTEGDNNILCLVILVIFFVCTGQATYRLKKIGSANGENLTLVLLNENYSRSFYGSCDQLPL